MNVVVLPLALQEVFQLRQAIISGVEMAKWNEEHIRMRCFQMLENNKKKNEKKRRLATLSGPFWGKKKAGNVSSENDSSRMKDRITVTMCENDLWAHFWLFQPIASFVWEFWWKSLWQVTEMFWMNDWYSYDNAAVARYISGWSFSRIFNGNCFWSSLFLASSLRPKATIDAILLAYSSLDW